MLLLLLGFLLLLRVHHALQVLCDVYLLQVLQLESLAVLLADVLALAETIKVVDEVLQLLVTLVIVEGYYRDTIVQLVPEGVHSVVDDDQVLELSVLDDAQVLDVDALLCTDAVVPVQPILNQLVLGVEQVQHHIRVCLVRGSEHYYLVAFVGAPEAL
jgi:hypothetical protein